MTVREESDNKPHGDTDIPSGDVKITSSEDVDELMFLFSSEKKTNLPLLDHLFSVQFSESKDFDSFFKRLFSSREQIAPLLREISNFGSLSAYFEDEKWSKHPMIAYVPKMYYITCSNPFTENQEYPIENWRWLDYFLNNHSARKRFDEEIKNSLLYAALHCDLETESDKFMQYFNRVVEKLEPRRDVVWRYSCFQYRKQGKTLTEISKIDPWENY